MTEAEKVALEEAQKKMKLLMDQLKHLNVEKQKLFDDFLNLEMTDNFEDSAEEKAKIVSS